MSAPRLHVLVPCAGVGARAGAAGPKQYAPLAGRPIVAHTVEAFRALGDRLATLALDAPCRIENDPRGETRRLW